MIKKYRGFLILTLITSLTFVAGCDDDNSVSGPGDEFERAVMLETYGNDFILPAYENLKEEADALAASANAFSADPTLATLSELRDQLKSTRMAWQYASLFEFGPAERNALRASLNIFPADTDKIESNMSSGNYVLGAIDNQAARGFAAIGYLIHGVAGTTDQEILDAFTDPTEGSQRATYVTDNSDFVNSTVTTITEEWQAAAGNYIGTFLSPDNAGVDVGSSLGQMVNALILHYERFVRDGKIGIPSGVRSAGIPRPTATEALYGGYSVQLAVENLRAIKLLFTADVSFGGLPGTGTFTGLEENLIAIGEEDLAAEIITELDEAIAAVQSLQDPLSGNIENDNDAVLAAFTEMQDVVVLLKADMASALGITITFQDNDGD